MDLKIAKEFIHIEGWLDRADDIVARGESTYFADVLLQEAGDSIMMKLGEAAKRLSVMNVPAPAGIDWASRSLTEISSFISTTKSAAL